jgi:hypothetical protein
MYDSFVMSLYTDLGFSSICHIYTLLFLEHFVLFACIYSEFRGVYELVCHDIRF